MMTIIEREVKGFIAEEDDRNYAKPTQAEAQTQMKETVVNKLQLGSNSASNGI